MPDLCTGIRQHGANEYRVEKRLEKSTTTTSAAAEEAVKKREHPVRTVCENGVRNGSFLAHPVGFPLLRNGSHSNSLRKERMHPNHWYKWGGEADVGVDRIFRLSLSMYPLSSSRSGESWMSLIWIWIIRHREIEQCESRGHCEDEPTAWETHRVILICFSSSSQTVSNFSQDPDPGKEWWENRVREESMERIVWQQMSGECSLWRIWVHNASAFFFSVKKQEMCLYVYVSENVQN